MKRGGGTALLARASRNATLRRGRIIVRLRCLAHDGPCNGRLSLSMGRLPAARKGAAAVTLGAARFSIPAGKTGKVKVRLRRRRARSRFSALRGRSLRRVRLSARATVAGTTTNFKLRLRRSPGAKRKRAR